MNFQTFFHESTNVDQLYKSRFSNYDFYHSTNSQKHKVRPVVSGILCFLDIHSHKNLPDYKMQRKIKNIKKCVSLQLQHNQDIAPLQAPQPAPPASAQSSPASQYNYHGSPWADLHTVRKIMHT